MSGLDSEDGCCHHLTLLRNSPSDLNARQSPTPGVLKVSHLTPPQLLFEELGANNKSNKELIISKKDTYIFTDIL